MATLVHATDDVAEDIRTEERRNECWEEGMRVGDDGECKDGINGASDEGGRLDSTRRTESGVVTKRYLICKSINYICLFLLSLYGDRSFR